MHKHEQSRPSGSRGRLLAAVLLNALITLAELVGGLLSGSLALISDALHNFNDTVSLGISLAARDLAGRDADARKTFGYQRFEILAAFFNLITLFIVALYLIKEGIVRFFDPQPIRGMLMFSVATLGLAANVASALLIRRGSRDSLNLRSAYLHIITDAASSVAVMAGGVLIMQFNLVLVDPALTIAISFYMMYHGYGALREVVDILMNASPSHLDLDGIVHTMREIECVQDIHHVHLWRMDEHTTALEAHVVMDELDIARLESVKSELKRNLSQRYGIDHATLEFEFVPCDQANEHCL